MSPFVLYSVVIAILVIAILVYCLLNLRSRQQSNGVVTHPAQVGQVSHGQVVATSIPWRSELSKIDIWYATYGSNMWKPRFLCYIEGGKVQGMERPCSGSMDKRPPKDVLWKTFPHRLFFGRKSTVTWGDGGVAFLHPKSSMNEEVHLCLYRITLEQFNDVLQQENGSSPKKNSAAFDLASLQSVENNRALSLEVFKPGWYRNVVYLGKEQDIPILTMTCTQSAIASFESGKLQLNRPAQEYKEILVKGLVEGGQLSEEKAVAYIEQASTRPIVLKSTPKARPRRTRGV